MNALTIVLVIGVCFLLSVVVVLVAMLWHTHQFHSAKDVENDLSATAKDLLSALRAELSKGTQPSNPAAIQAAFAAPPTGPPANPPNPPTV